MVRAGEIEFVMEGAEENESRVIQYLRDRTAAMIKRSSITGFSVVPCSTNKKDSLRICLNAVGVSSDNAIFSYGVNASSYAYVVGESLREGSTIVYVGEAKDSAFRYLVSRGFDVIFVSIHSIDRLLSKREKLYVADALVLARDIHTPSAYLARAFEVFGNFGASIITPSVADFEYGSTHAVMANTDALLSNFTNVLQFFEQTDILKSSIGVCVASVVTNPKTIKNTNQSILQSDVHAIESALKKACACGEYNES